MMIFWEPIKMIIIAYIPKEVYRRFFYCWKIEAKLKSLAERGKKERGYYVWIDLRLNFS